MKKLIFPALILLLIACNNAAENNAETDDTLQTEEVAEESSEIQEIRNSFPQLFSFYESRDSSFSPNGFEIAQSDTMNLLPAREINENDLKPYYPYFIYNGDSTKAIDLYSYNIMLTEKGGKTIVEAGGPDTEIAIVDFLNKTRQRIFFAGPSFVIHDGSWLNNETVLLAGGEILEGEKTKPMILKINLSTKSRQYFNYPDTLSVNANTYKDSRIDIQ